MRSFFSSVAYEDEAGTRQRVHRRQRAPRLTDATGEHRSAPAASSLRSHRETPAPFRRTLSNFGIPAGTPGTTGDGGGRTAARPKPYQNGSQGPLLIMSKSAGWPTDPRSR
jgi:hypothetical protein